MSADGRHDKSLRFEISTKLSDLCHIILMERQIIASNSCKFEGLNVYKIYATSKLAIITKV
jgi:hypothetical protein